MNCVAEPMCSTVRALIRLRCNQDGRPDRDQDDRPYRVPEDTACTSEAGRVRGCTVATSPGFGYMVATRCRKTKRPIRENWPKRLNSLVGAVGFEPTTN